MLVQNKGNHSYQANGLTLIPGTNKVDELDFEKFIAHPLMAHLVQTGQFVYDKDKTKPNAKELIALIDDTFDVDTLKGIRENEDRKTVLDAIDKRITELLKPEK